MKKNSNVQKSTVATIALRQMSLRAASQDDRPVDELSSMAQPLHNVLNDVAKQLAELRKYKEKFGELE
jgi:hypothetical protein